MHLFCSLMIKNKNHNPIRLYQNYGSYLVEVTGFELSVTDDRKRSYCRKKQAYFKAAFLYPYHQAKKKNRYSASF